MTVPLAPRPVRYGLALAVAGGLFVASVVDPPGAGPPPELLGVALDRWLHAVGYAALAGALLYARAAADRRALAVAVAVAVAYGGGLEVLQAFLPARAFSPADLLADALGALVAALGWRAGAVRGLVASVPE